jgi:hypothetical protein
MASDGHENLAEALCRRNNCRTGLLGLSVVVHGEQDVATIVNTFWKKDKQLAVVLESGRQVMSDRCSLMAEWPVVCCPPSCRSASARSGHDRKSF